MSLINDALKRAKESQKEPPPVTPHFMTVASRPRGMSMGLIIVAAIFFAAACFFIGLAIAKKNSAPPVTAVVTTTVKPMETQVTPTIVQTRPSAPEPKSVKVVTAPEPAKMDPPSAVASTPAVSNAVVDAMPPPPPPPPQPRLQAVVFDPQNPSAIVNGKIVHVNDVIGDFRIRAILRNAVLIEFGDGTMRRLNLGE